MYSSRKYERIPETVEAVPVHEIEYSYRMARKYEMPKWVQDALYNGKLVFQDHELCIRTDLGFRRHSVGYLCHSLDNDEYFFVQSNDFNRNFRRCK